MAKFPFNELGTKKINYLLRLEQRRKGKRDRRFMADCRAELQRRHLRGLRKES